MQPETAYQVIHDEIFLDGNARQNLATFVTTWMEPQASALYAEAFDKNMIDKDEYLQTAAIEERCVHILADLWNSPEPRTTIGTSAIGSSEACMLAGSRSSGVGSSASGRGRALGHAEHRVQQLGPGRVGEVRELLGDRAAVRPDHEGATTSRPRACSRRSTSTRSAVVGILGVTYDGRYEPISDLAQALDDLQDRTGLDVPLHVDGASGAFIAPFLDPDLAWDFRLPRVHSISTSGHKFGLVYPGLGWVVWAKAAYLPEDLIFSVSYLGREHADAGVELLSTGSPGAAPVLQLPSPGP